MLKLFLNLFSGLEFLPTSEESSACRGLHEASLVSVSVDHQVEICCICLRIGHGELHFQVCVHNVSSQSTMSSLVAMILVVIVLLLTFVLASYLGL